MTNKRSEWGDSYPAESTMAGMAGSRGTETALIVTSRCTESPGGTEHPEPPGIRPEHAWAQTVISAELEVSVQPRHGSEPFDLRIGPLGRPTAAIAVIGGIDEEWTAAWRAGPERGKWKADGVRGNWIVRFSATTPANRLIEELPRLLAALEAQGLPNVYRSRLARPVYDRLADEMDRLGLESAQCYVADGAGVVSLTLPDSGGAVDSRGRALPAWIGEFLRDPARAEVLDGLRVDAEQRHVFLVTDLIGAPWAIVSYLTQWGHGERQPPTPPARPDLPEPVTHLWVVSTFGRFGVRWDGASWHPFAVRFG